MSTVARDGECFEGIRDKSYFNGVNFDFLVLHLKIFKNNTMLTLFLIYGGNAILEEEYYVNYVKDRRQQISPEFGLQSNSEFLDGLYSPLHSSQLVLLGYTLFLYIFVISFVS